MSKNLIQYASIFDAAGAVINFDTNSMEASVMECPKDIKNIVDGAIDEIANYLDTGVYEDGIAILGISDYIDGEPNPIPSKSRSQILDGVGLTRNGRYISQSIALLKVNKSWHTSEVSNECSYFGEYCTHRGITEVKGKRGRKATRSPEEYHEQKSNGTINREQLVTESLEALHRAIPAEMVTNASRDKSVIRLNEIENLDSDELAILLERIKTVELRRNGN